MADGIFGVDDRTPVADTTQPPYDGIAYIEGAFADGTSYSCTGFFIDATHVVTAGHSLYQPGHGFVTAMRIAPGRNGGVQADAAETVVGIGVNQHWVNGQDPGHDYGLVTVSSGTGYVPKTCFELMPMADTASFRDLAVTTAGYPGEKGSGDLLYRAAGTIDMADDTVLYSTHLAITAGDSGSPVWVTDPLTGRPAAVGIAAAGGSRTDSYTRLSANAVGQILTFVQADEAGYNPAGLVGATKLGAYAGGVDLRYYQMAYSDETQATDPAGDFHKTGWTRGRNPNAVFNTAWYLATNPDVAAAKVDPLLHYELWGWREGRDPSAAFAGSRYLKDNPDVAAAQVSPMDHYLLWGLAEHRQL